MASLKIPLYLVSFGESRKVSANLVNFVNFVESGWIFFKIIGSDKLVKHKLSRSELLIKIVEIMITIDPHIFSPVFTKRVQIYYKYCIPLCHPIFTET